MRRSVVRSPSHKGIEHGDSAGRWQPRDKLGTGGQQAGWLIRKLVKYMNCLPFTIYCSPFTT